MTAIAFNFRQRYLFYIFVENRISGEAYQNKESILTPIDR